MVDGGHSDRAIGGEAERLRLALEEREALLALSARAALDLVGSRDIDADVARVLARLGSGTGVDRVYLFQNRPPAPGAPLLSDQRFEWVAEGIEPQIDNPDLQGLDIGALFPTGMAKLRLGQVYGGLVAELPPSERSILDPQGILSILIVPVIVDGVFWGFVGFDAVRRARPWSTVEADLLKVVAAALGAALQRRADESDLREAAAVFESTRDAIAVTDAQGRITRANPAMSSATGLPPQALVGLHWSDLFGHAAPREVLRAEAAEALSTRGFWQAECTGRHRDGVERPHWLELSRIRGGTDRAQRLLLVATDISHLKASEARLDHLAHHDALTGLPNRRRAHQALETALERASRDDTPLAVLFADLDRFKGINDSLGHPVGDELLVEAAGRLRATLGEGVFLSRFGGDEFVVVLEGLQATHAERIAERLCVAMRPAFRLSGGEIDCALSIGISRRTCPDDSADSLLQQADLAMYRAKEAGRDQVQVFSEVMAVEAREARRMEARLRQAIRMGELQLHYQARLSLADGRIRGAEALLRVPDGAGGFLPAGPLVAMAERLGLIVPVGRWVLDAACRQLAAWRAAGMPAITVSVNISARQFYADDLLASVDAALAAHGVAPGAIEVELTESVLMDRPDEASRVLAALRARGIRVALDDFGSGFSSLSYLMRFPLDRLKVDHQFVAVLPGDARAGAIARAIVMLAAELGLDTVAEGVERTDQRDFLAALGFDEAQGYLFSRPVPADAFAGLPGLAPDATGVNARGPVDGVD